MTRAHQSGAGPPDGATVNEAIERSGILREEDVGRARVSLLEQQRAELGGVAVAHLDDELARALATAPDHRLALLPYGTASLTRSVDASIDGADGPITG